MTTRGIQLNNYMNIMHSPAFTWRGEIVPTIDPDGRLAQFDTVLDGIRAGAILLLNYFNKDGCNTITKIISRYAPQVENPTKSYISFVAQQCGVDDTALIDMNDPSLLRLVISAIIRFEQGNWAGVSFDTLCQGTEEALGPA